MSSSRYMRRVGRRQFLRTAALVGGGLAGAALVGCGEDDGEGTPATSSNGQGAPTSTAVANDGEPRRGGMYRVAMPRVDGHWSGSHSGLMPGLIGGLFNESFFRMRGNLETPIIFLQAESVEFVDPTEMVVKYRGNFHDLPPVSGRPVEAEDVYQGFKMRIEDETAFARAMYAVTTDIDQTQVVDERTLRHVLKTPVGQYYDTQTMGVLPRERIEAHLSGQEDMRQAFPPIGGGAWMYDDHQEGSFLQFKGHNAGYSRAPEPYLDGVRLIQISDASAQEAAFRAGDIDALQVSSAPTFDRIVNDMGDRVNGYEYTSTGSLGLGMNMHLPVFRDPRGREAIARAVDRDQLIATVLFGRGVKVGPGINPVFNDIALSPDDPVFQDFTRADQGEAAQLVEALKGDGTYDGSPLNFVINASNAEHEAVAPLVGDMLRSAGFTVNIQSVPLDQYEERTRGFDANEVNYGLTLRGLQGRFQWMLYPHHSERQDGAFGSNSLMDPEVDRLIEEMDATPDGEPELADTARQFQEAIADRWPLILPLYSGFQFRIFDSGLRGVMPSYSNLFPPTLWWAEDR